MDLDTARSSRDWVASPRAHLLAWWMPKLAVVGSLLAPPGPRAAVWVGALIWMGTACILNSRRCQRTVCRYTGPWYLAMIVPVFVLASGIVAAGLLVWIGLSVIILGGGFLIWFASERAWGRFS